MDWIKKLGKRKPTLIYICGSHSVGKSTIINMYCNYLDSKKQPYQRNESPRIRVTKDKLYTGVDDLNQMYITFDGLSKMCSYFTNITKTPYISDRWLIDNIAYSSLSPTITLELKYIHFRFLNYFLKEWNVKVFYIPVEFLLESDGVRPESIAYQNQVDIALRKLLNSEKISYTTLTGSPEERFTKMVKSLKY